MTDVRSEGEIEQQKRWTHELERVLVTRIQTLEREGRRLKRLWMATMVAMATILGLGTALVIVSQHGLPGSVPDVIEARQFLLRDPSGAVRGAWGTLPDGSLRLTLQAPGTKAGVTLTALKGGAAGLTISDSSGRSRGVLGLLPDETTSLTFGDRSGTTRSSLGLNPEGSATLILADRGGAVRASMGVDSRGAGTLTVIERPGYRGDDQEPGADTSPPDTTTGLTAPPPTPTPRKK
jgi:hypothetical protein